MYRNLFGTEQEKLKAKDDQNVIWAGEEMMNWQNISLLLELESRDRS